MPRMNVALLRRTRAMVPTLVLACGLLAACNNSNNGRTIINNNGLDCGLFRSDLTGTWVINFAGGSRDRINCDNASFNTNTGTGITAPTTTMNFTNVAITGSEFAASFLVTADGPSMPPTTWLIGSVQADSCLALFKVWDDLDKAYIVCLGGFDVSTGTIAASCDSVDVDLNADGAFDAFCDLSDLLNV